MGQALSESKTVLTYNKVEQVLLQSVVLLQRLVLL